MNAKIKINYMDENGNVIENPVEGQKAYSPETKKLYVLESCNEYKSNFKL
jgi:hypothetical protein